MIARDIGAYIVTKVGVAKAGAGDLAATGAGVSRAGKLSAVIAGIVQANLASGEAATGVLKVEHGPAATGPWAAYEGRNGEHASGIVASGAFTAAASGNHTFAVEGDLDLSLADEYVRVIATTDVPATGTENLVTAALILGGADELPAA